METTSKILVFSDVHLSLQSKPADERWFPPRVAKMSIRQQNAYLHYWDDLTLRAYVQYLLAEAQKMGSFDSILSLGDNTSGNREQGMVDEEARAQFHSFERILTEMIPRTAKYYVFGGHDIGYHTRSNLIGARNGGPSWESFLTAQTLLGSPWQSFCQNDYTFLLLNSEIIKASRVSNRHQTFFLKEVAAQNEFLVETLNQTKEKIILVIHEPQQLRALWPLIKPHRHKVVLTLAGHLHLKGLGAFYRLRSSIARRLNVQVVPSPWGIATPWRAIGHGGFCTLTLQGDSFDLQYHQIDPAKSASSF